MCLPQVHNAVTLVRIESVTPRSQALYHCTPFRWSVEYGCGISWSYSFTICKGNRSVMLNARNSLFTSDIADNYSKLMKEGLDHWLEE